MAIEITDQNFETLVIESDQPVIIDLWAQWCTSCKTVAETIEELIPEVEGKALVGKLNVDENPEIASRFKIRNIPAVVYFKDGSMVDKYVGTGTRDEYLKKLKAIC